MTKNLKTEDLVLKDENKFDNKGGSILGVLEGPVADYIHPTRNGRLYGNKVWKNVLKNPLVQEQFKNGGIVGELDHPVDRDDICTEKVAVIMPEPPVEKNGQYYGKFNILNTPCGKIVYTLAKAGFKFGVSSRGTGEVIDTLDGEEVDPDSYEFTCFDVVLLPAVESARMNLITEGLEKKKVNYKKLLKESLEKSSDKEKEIMKETLDHLHIQYNEDLDDEEAEYVLTNGRDEYIVTSLNGSECKIRTVDGEYLEYTSSENKEASDIWTLDQLEQFKKAFKLTEKSEDNLKEDLNEEESEIEEESEEHIEEENPENPTELTIKELKQTINEFDDESPVEFSNVNIDGIEYTTDLSIEDVDGKVIIGVNCIPSNEENSDNISEVELEKDDLELTVDDIKANDEELLENFQSVLKENIKLNEELKTLQNEKAVSNAKVETLNEDLNKFKSIAANAGKRALQIKNIETQNINLNSKVKELTEQLNTVNNKVKSLTEEKENLIKESKIKLEENINKQNEVSNKKLKEALEKLKSANDKVSKYKKLVHDVANRYIESKALSIGVRSQEITNRLNESYTLSDVDRVCEDLQEYTLSVSKLPFNFDKPGNMKAKIRNDQRTNPLRSLYIQNRNDEQIDDYTEELAERFTGK